MEVSEHEQILEMAGSEMRVMKSSKTPFCFQRECFSLPFEHAELQSWLRALQRHLALAGAGYIRSWKVLGLRLETPALLWTPQGLFCSKELRFWGGL